MKRGTKWLLSTAGVTLALGVVLSLTGWALGGSRAGEMPLQNWNIGLFNIGPAGIFIGGKYGLHIGPDGISGWSKDGPRPGMEGGMRVLQKELDAFSSLDAEVSFGDVWVETGDTYSVDIAWNLNSIDFSCQVEDGTLKIQETSGGGGGNHLDGTCQVIVTLPQEVRMEEINLATGFGNVEVTLEGTVAQEAVLKTGLGNVNCQGFVAEKLTAESDMGNVEFYLLGSREDYTWTLMTNMGEVLVEDWKQSGMGDITDRGGSGPNQVSGKSSLGNVSLDFSE